MIKRPPDKILFWILIFLLLLSAGCQPADQITCLNDKDCQEVSPYISTVFEFSNPIKPEWVEEAWHITPNTHGKWIWESNRRARWIASSAYQAGEEIIMGFDWSASRLDQDHKNENVTWRAIVRQPSVLFLAPVEDGMELYRLNPYDLNEMNQLTETEGKIHDYAASPDGEQLVFSVLNSQGGADIWIWNRRDDSKFLLLECGSDFCESMSLSPNNVEFAFTQKSLNSNDQSKRNAPQVMIFNLITGEKNTFLTETDIYGYHPEWSPNGEWLTYWLGLGQGIEAVNLMDGRTFNLNTASGNAGCWNPESQILFFSDLLEIDDEDHIESLSSVLFQADVDKKKISHFISGYDDRIGMSYLNPVCHPEGDGLLTYVQPSMNLPGRFLWWISNDGELKEILSDDISTIVSHASWDPSGYRVLFSLSKLSSNNLGAELVIWDKNHPEDYHFITSGVFKPLWLP